MHSLPELGHLGLSAVDRYRVQDLVDRLVARGLSPSSVRNAVLPLRAIYRRAVARSEVAVNPTLGLSLPAVRGRRERIARPEEAAALIAALAEADRALWATALYGGLRRGELQALRWDDVDLDGGLIRVERSWDRVEGPIEPKSRAGGGGFRSRPASEGTCSPIACSRVEAARGSPSGRRSTGRSMPRRSSTGHAPRGAARASSRSPCTSAATPTPPS